MADTTLTLFDVLKTIGAHVEEMWQGEWEGPILFRDSKDQHVMLLVKKEDHDEVEKWLEKHPHPDKLELESLARGLLFKMGQRPIPLPE